MLELLNKIKEHYGENIFKSGNEGKLISLIKDMARGGIDYKPVDGVPFQVFCDIMRKAGSDNVYVSFVNAQKNSNDKTLNEFVAKFFKEKGIDRTATHSILRLVARLAGYNLALSKRADHITKHPKSSSTISTCVSSTKLPALNSVGNSIGNIVNNGIVAGQGEWIYYLNMSGDRKLWKMKTSGEGKQKVGDIHVNNINVVGDWIYCMNNSLPAYAMYKMKTDGTGGEVMARAKDGAVSNIYVIDGWIYYTPYEQGIHKMKVDGTSKQRIERDGVNCMAVADDWIYYSKKDGYNHNSNINKGYSLYKIRTNGTGRQKLNNDFFVGRINVVDDWIFYSDNSYNLYKIKTDGTKKQSIVDKNGQQIVASAVNVVDDWIYCNAGLDSTICKMKTDGTNMLGLSEDKSYHINILGDWLFYTNSSDNQKIYKIRTDGTGRQKVG